MGGNLIIPGRAHLTGYAGLAGALRSRVRPGVIVVAVDVLAVALAFGALHIAGSMVAGQFPAPFQPVVTSLAHPISQTPASVAPIVDAVRIIPAPGPAFVTAGADAGVLFAKPMIFATGFTDAPGATFVSTETSAGEDPAPLPVENAVAVADQALPPVAAPPVEKIASIAVRGRELADAAVASAANIVDGSLDRLLLRGDARASVAVAQVAALDASVAATAPLLDVRAGASADAGVVGPVAEVAGGVTSAAAPVVAAVVQPVTQVVGNVVGLLN